MNEPRDERVDRLLQSALAEDPLAGERFTRGVMDLIGRRTRRRRAILTAAWMSAAAIAAATLPATSATWASVTPSSLAALMVLGTMSSLVWTATAD